MRFLFLDLLLSSLFLILLLAAVLQLDRRISTLIVADEFNSRGEFTFELLIERIYDAIKSLFLLTMVGVGF